MFEIKDLKYKNILNIPAITLSSGEISCLFGPSGCGKTTLLRMLNGMISPDSGSIALNGGDLATLDLVQLRRNVVMLGQQSPIFPGNVRDNLNLAADFQDLPAFREEALHSVLTAVGLSEKGLEENPELFSGGEKQRLALCRVLLLKPDVLLLDEPCAGLDSATETVIMNAIAADQQSRNTTCILVTHSEEAARSYAHTIFYMKSGSVTAVERVFGKGLQS